MYVEHLSLVDFRNYATAEVDLKPGVNVFTGPNGQGKTNLVEAVEYLATLSSHRAAADAPLIRAGAEQAVVRAKVVAGLDDSRTLLLEIEINPGRANRAYVNRVAQRSARELLGGVRVVMFTPDDLAVVKGDPAERRAFLDDLVVTRWPRLAGERATYDRVIRQRNALLKTLAGHPHRISDDEAATLDVWDEHLARSGAEVMQARLETLEALCPLASSAYADIAPTNADAGAVYQSGMDITDLPDDREARTAELRARLLAATADRRRDEVRRGVSLVGPHRDEVALSIGGLPARGYASHGESWSLALALRLGAFALLRADGVSPVLILDDVFAELDATRRVRLADAVADADQLLVTAAVPDDVPQRLSGCRFAVRFGTVQAVGEAVGELPESRSEATSANKNSATIRGGGDA